MPQNASKLTSDGRFKALFVGPKSSGKTVAACSFRGKDPNKKTYVWDFDDRIRGILGAKWIDRNRIDFDYYPPRVGPQQTPTYQKINDMADKFLAEAVINMCPYDTMIADSITSECFAMLCDAIPLTHQSDKGKDKGRKIGTLSMAGPNDYGFEAQATYNLLAFLRSMPGLQNMICTAHIVDKYGKANPEDPYSESIIIGEKLSLRDKIGANIGIYFDHIFRFDRKMMGGIETFWVEFRSDIATTSFEELPVGEFNITGINFYETLMKKLTPKHQDELAQTAEVK